MMALRSIFEGDARVAETIWQTIGPDSFANDVQRRWKASIARTKTLTNLHEAPYRAGEKLVLDLYSLGGWTLVDAALKHPPRSTTQMLHTEKYLAGELPVPIAKQPIAAGWTPRAAGSLGEMSIRSLLAELLPVPMARDAAAGWRGDAYVIAEGNDHHLAGVWTTVFQSDGYAERFEEALRKWAAFLDDAPRGEAFVVPPLIDIERVGAVVYVVRGWGDEAPDAASILATIGKQPKNEPPIAEAKKLTVEEPITAFDFATFADGKVASTRYHLVADVPQSFEAFVGEPATVFELERPGPAPRAFAAVVVVDPNAKPSTPYFAGHTAIGETTAPATMGSISAMKIEWQLVDSAKAAVGKVTLLSFLTCGGKRKIWVITVSRSAEDDAALETFLHSLRIDRDAACM